MDEVRTLIFGDTCLEQGLVIFRLPVVSLGLCVLHFLHVLACIYLYVVFFFVFVLLGFACFQRRLTPMFLSIGCCF